MNHKQRNRILSLIILTTIHILFCESYLRFYAYMNMQQKLPLFLGSVAVGRYLFLSLIFYFGYNSWQKNERNVVPFYIAFLLLNIALPYLMHFNISF